MKIAEIVIEGAKGRLAITSTSSGAMVTRDHAILAEFGRDEPREERFAKALVIAGHVYGTTRGKPNATNSMVHDVLAEIERVAGC